MRAFYKDQQTGSDEDQTLISVISMLLLIFFKRMEFFLVVDSTLGGLFNNRQLNCYSDSSVIIQFLATIPFVIMFLGLYSTIVGTLSV